MYFLIQNIQNLIGIFATSHFEVTNILVIGWNRGGLGGRWDKIFGG